MSLYILLNVYGLFKIECLSVHCSFDVPQNESNMIELLSVYDYGQTRVSHLR